MKPNRLKRMIQADIAKTKRDLKDPRLKSLIAPAIVLLIIILGWNYFYAKAGLGRSLYQDYPYPMFIIEEPSGEYNPETGLRYLYISPENTKIIFWGGFPFWNDGKMPDWGEPQIYIYAEVDGKYLNSVAIPSNQQTFEIPLDFSNLSTGKHYLKVYAKHRADWRTWESLPEEYEITIGTAEATSAPQPVILSLSKVKGTDVYLITGNVEPGIRISFEGASIVPSEVMASSGLVTTTTTSVDGTTENKSVMPIETGYFWAYIKPEKSGQLKIYTQKEFGEKSRNPLVFEISKLDELAKKLGQSITTDIDFNIGVDQFDKTLTIYLPSKSPLLEQILQDRSKIQNFVTMTSMPLVINGIEISGYFDNSPLEVTIDKDIAQVVLDSRSRATGDLNPIGETKIIISPKSEYQYIVPVGKLRDLKIKISDYSVTSLFPIPDNINGNEYTWKNFSEIPQVEIVLKQNLGQVLRNLPRWSLYDFTGKKYLLANTLSLLFIVISATPIFGLIWLVSIYVNEEKENRRLKNRSLSILINAGAFFIIPRLWNMVDMLRYELQWANISKWELFEYLQYKYQFLSPFYNFRADLYKLGINENVFVGLLILAIAIVISSYLAWATRQILPIGNAIFRIILKAVWVIFATQSLIVLFNLYGFKFLGLQPDNTYPIWAASGWLLYSISVDLFIRISNIANEHENITPRMERVRSLGILLAFILSIAVAYTIGSTPSEIYGADNQFQALYFVFSALSDGAMLFSAFGAILLAVMLARMNAWDKRIEGSPSKYKIVQLQKVEMSGKERFWYIFGLILFTGYVVGVRDLILSVPISALASLVVYPYIYASQEKMAKIDFLFGRIHENRSKLLMQLANDLSATKLYAKLNQLLVNLSSGKISPSEYDTSEAIIRKEIEHIETEKIVADISSKDFVLAVGPEESSLKNAFIGLRWAFILQIPLLFVLFNTYFWESIYAPWVSLSVSIFNFIFRWIMIGFFFGLLYEKIRGNNGIRKAITLTLAIIVAYLPYRLIVSSWSTTTFQSFILQMSFTALFILGLGLVFDWLTLKKHGFGISYMQVVLNDMPSLVYTSSFLVTTLTVVISTVLSGQLAQVLSSIVTSLLPVVTNIPGIR